MTICVDGITQETYGLTRIGGKIDRVLSNLERLCAYRLDRRRRYPKVGVQFIKFDHNSAELPSALQLFRNYGVDQVTHYWGSEHNYTDVDVTRVRIGDPRQARWRPLCEWPYFGMLVRYDGHVIPCCNHRLTAQYHIAGDPRAIGNVLTSGVRAVWDSAAYSEIRCITCDPASAVAVGWASRSFCYGCDRLFETDRTMRTRIAGTK